MQYRLLCNRGIFGTVQNGFFKTVSNITSALGDPFI